MRILFTLISSLLSFTCIAQEVAKQQYIKLTYLPSQTYTEEAVEVIQAVSKVLAKSTVDYRAGHAIELLPGFQASQGAIFTAHIQAIPELDRSLRLTVFPNPFEQSTTIDFDLPEAGVINLFVVDAKGQVIGNLLENSYQAAGKHQLEWKADALSPGQYIPVLKTERQQASSRVIKK